ncbi:DUF2252 domain-containing protein [Mycolicibacter heraklionensis]|uniref:DUF2252 domain-containing protein n=1 Tax=Mycolicibacter heraklionensis TaxID=512402 RepID=A0A9X7ZDR8_9MYCO|nr:DUF2252 domain-containing protein [Mycolicibacter heraklionensis]QZA06064.1 DUF2252 domain-containing protein [Mycolicibacter heraklionensis]
MSAKERREYGRSRRTVLPRSALGGYEPSSRRADPIALLEAQSRSRVPELVPIRYARMAASPYAFFRGSAVIMAADLATGPHTGLRAQLCGDAHLSNFGLFASPERQLMFDLNDFDETLPGPWEWDVKRLVASAAVLCRSRGFGPAKQESVVTACAGAYRNQMRELARLGELDVWYAQSVIDSVLLGTVQPVYAKEIRRTAVGALSRGRQQAVDKLTRSHDGRRRLISDPPLIVPAGDLVSDAVARLYDKYMRKLFRDYVSSLPDDRRVLARRYRYIETGRKVVGVGSVGTRTWIVLLEGRGSGDPLLMQVKEARPSVLEPHLKRSRYPNAGERVVAGQRLMQATSDILLGWLHAIGPDGHHGDYYVRQLWDMKGSADVESMRPKVLTAYVQACGQALARAHSRSGDRVAIAAYLGKGDNADRALTRFAMAYAEQNERDYQALRAAADSGRIAVA